LCNPSNINAGYGTKHDHRSGKVLAYALAAPKDSALKQLKKLLAPFSIRHFYTDGWGAYLRLPKCWQNAHASLWYSDGMNASQYNNAKQPYGKINS
jgi:hypothetical protein